MNFKKYLNILYKSAETTATGLLIVGAANLFVWILAAAKIPDKLTEIFVPILRTPTIFMCVLLLLLYIVGCFMETVAAISIIAPIIVPIGVAMGIDPLHLGIIFVIALIVGFVTPPFGVNLFTTCSITKVDFSEVVKGAIPFVLVMMIIITILAFVPKTVTWLPGILHGK